jgi:hypothetical protein
LPNLSCYPKIYLEELMKLRKIPSIVGILVEVQTRDIQITKQECCPHDFDQLLVIILLLINFSPPLIKHHAVKMYRWWRQNYIHTYLPHWLETRDFSSRSFRAISEGSPRYPVEGRGAWRFPQTVWCDDRNLSFYTELNGGLSNS